MNHARPPKYLFLTGALLLIAILLLAILPHPAAAQEEAAPGRPGSILIWPVNPVIGADDRAAALWLENPGGAPTTLQIRIYAWAQADGGNVYAPQDAILGTPPIVTIAPGERQLIRLTRTAASPARTEQAYRVVVDEIPAAEGPAGAGAAVRFRMRYSLPLFAYGEGLADGSAPGARGKRAPASPAAPEADPTLLWRTGRDADGAFLEIRNAGPIHARLTGVALVGDGGSVPVAEGLLGYVLPGAAMRWPIAADARDASELLASINGAAPAPILRQPD